MASGSTPWELFPRGAVKLNVFRCSPYNSKTQDGCTVARVTGWFAWNTYNLLEPKGPAELIIAGDKPCKKGFCKSISLSFLKQALISKMKHLRDGEGQGESTDKNLPFTETWIFHMWKLRLTFALVLGFYSPARICLSQSAAGRLYNKTTFPNILPPVLHSAVAVRLFRLRFRLHRAVITNTPDRCFINYCQDLHS